MRDRADIKNGKDAPREREAAEENGVQNETQNGAAGERVGGASTSVQEAENRTENGVLGEAADETRADAQAESDELELLRGELELARAETADFKNRFLRARADLENYRRRAAQDLARAREAGLDSAIVTVLSVYDDLGRALSVSGDDPNQLLPGLEAVREGLRRNLEALGIAEIGAKGELFNPDLHEALTAVPTQDEAAANTIAEVIQTGFVKEERLVRPARVVVFQG